MDSKLDSWILSWIPGFVVATEFEIGLKVGSQLHGFVVGKGLRKEFTVGFKSEFGVGFRDARLIQDFAIMSTMLRDGQIITSQ